MPTQPNAQEAKEAVNVFASIGILDSTSKFNTTTGHVFTRHLILPITYPNDLVFHQDLIAEVEFELVYQVE